MDADQLSGQPTYQNLNTSTNKGRPTNAKKPDVRFIKLQQIEHELAEKEFLKYGLYIILIGVVVRLVIDLCTVSTRDFFELGTRAIQTLGYVYGLQAFYEKNKYLTQILVYFLSMSFGLLGYFIYYDYDRQHFPSMAFDIFTVLINIFLLDMAIRFCKLVDERYRLRRLLGKE